MSSMPVILSSENVSLGLCHVGREVALLEEISGDSGLMVFCPFGRDHVFAVNLSTSTEQIVPQQVL